MKTLLFLFFAFIQSTLVWAQSDFPNKPVTIVVATPAGGATDKTVRLLVKQLQTNGKMESLLKTVLVRLAILLRPM